MDWQTIGAIAGAVTAVVGAATAVSGHLVKAVHAARRRLRRTGPSPSDLVKDDRPDETPSAQAPSDVSLGLAVTAFIASDVDLDVLIDGEPTLRIDHANGFDHASATIVVEPNSEIAFSAPGIEITRRVSQLVDAAERKIDVRIGTDTRANIPITPEQRRSAMGTVHDVPALIGTLQHGASAHARAWAATRLGAIGDARKQAGKPDDVAYLRRVITTLTGKELCGDPERVGLTGGSNGGGMTAHMTCAAADLLTAAASVSGGYSSLPPCHPSRRLPIHGLHDPIVPYRGKGPDHAGAVRTWLRGWLRRNGCTGTAQRSQPEDKVQELRWTCPNGRTVIHDRVLDAQHGWRSPASFNSTERTWRFFAGSFRRERGEGRRGRNGPSSNAAPSLSNTQKDANMALLRVGP